MFSSHLNIDEKGELRQNCKSQNSLLPGIKFIPKEESSQGKRAYPEMIHSNQVQFILFFFSDSVLGRRTPGISIN